MKTQINWRAIALFFMLSTICFVVVGLFFIKNLRTQNKPQNNSFLESYLKSENDLLEKQQDSLKSTIRAQKQAISEKDSLLIILSNQKNKLKIVYYEKYHKIDNYSIRQLINEFDTIFAKNGIY
jgi:hypothetical protein